MRTKTDPADGITPAVCVLEIHHPTQPTHHWYFVSCDEVKRSADYRQRIRKGEASADMQAAAEGHSHITHAVVLSIRDDQALRDFTGHLDHLRARGNPCNFARMRDYARKGRVSRSDLIDLADRDAKPLVAAMTFVTDWVSTPVGIAPAREGSTRQETTTPAPPRPQPTRPTPAAAYTSHDPEVNVRDTSRNWVIHPPRTPREKEFVDSMREFLITSMDVDFHEPTLTRFCTAEETASGELRAVEKETVLGRGVAALETSAPPRPRPPTRPLPVVHVIAENDHVTLRQLVEQEHPPTPPRPRPLKLYERTAEEETVLERICSALDEPPPPPPKNLRVNE